MNIRFTKALNYIRKKYTYQYSSRSKTQNLELLSRSKSFLQDKLKLKFIGKKFTHHRAKIYTS